MATRSTKKSGNKKSQKPHMKVRDLKPRKDAKGGGNIKLKYWG